MPIERSSPPAISLSILMVASEGAPFSKTGGLGDVMGSLPRALDRLGHRVAVVLPRTRGIDVERYPFRHARIRLGRAHHDVRFVQVRASDRLRTTLVDCPELYDREGLYGVGAQDYTDNARRFALLARAALELAAEDEERFDVVHGHDWHAGLVPVYLTQMSSGRLGGLASVLTIHNLAFQGLFPPDTLDELDLGRDLFTIDGMEYWGTISFLKAGINFSDAITTVSPTYAKEIQTRELGFGFEGIIARRAGVLTGILNGIDDDRWNPATDPFLPEPYSADRLEGKRAAKRALLARFGLPADNGSQERPLVGMVSRLVDQKGFDLLAGLGQALGAIDASFVLVGTGEPAYEAFWRELAGRHPDRIAAHIGFSEELAHLVEGGADLFLMPSRFEPCGLNQLYSLRYGTVPVVRAVGGLADTVVPYETRTPEANGFVFREYSPDALLEALQRALAVYARKPEWRALQLAGMRTDHSWDVSARAYVKVYREVLRRAAGRNPIAGAEPGRPAGAPHRRMEQETRWHRTR